MSSIFLKKIAPPAQSPPAGIGAMTGILIKDHDFLKNHLKIGKTKTGKGTISLKKLGDMEGKRGRERKGRGAISLKIAGQEVERGQGKRRGNF